MNHNSYIAWRTIMMKIFIALAFAFIVSGSAYAGTDAICVSDCMKLNNPKPFCVSQCSYPDNAGKLPPPDLPGKAPVEQKAQALKAPAPQVPPSGSITQAPPSGAQCQKTCMDEGSPASFCQRLCSKLAPDAMMPDFMAQPGRPAPGKLAIPVRPSAPDRSDPLGGMPDTGE